MTRFLVASVAYGICIGFTAAAILLVAFDAHP